MDERILNDLKCAFGIKVSSFSPVPGGYLNLKWRVHSPQGNFLVKQYSTQRFPARKLREIEQALTRQMLLHERGVACPRVYAADGRIIRMPQEQLPYMVMDFAPGHVETPDNCTPAQLYSLGEACGRMHVEFMRLPAQGVKGFPLQNEAILAPLHALIDDVPTGAPDAFYEAIRSIRPIVQNLTGHFLSGFARSLCHEDFSGDNMLFLNDRLSVIVDFDRNQFSLRLHDVARALLSLTLADDRLNADLIQAFQRGYHQWLPLSLTEIADALRLAWCMEAPWWIQPRFFADASGKVGRFMQEMQFLTQNWWALDELIHP